MKRGHHILHNGQKKEGVEDFVTYCYVCFEAEGVCYVIVMVDSKFENS